MFRVLQIAMVSFVLSIVLGLQQCSHEEDVDQKKSVIDEREDTQPSHEKVITSISEEKQVVVKEEKIKDALPHTVKKEEENLTQSNISKKIEIIKEESVSVVDDNESIVIQRLISDIVKDNNIQKEVNDSSQNSAVQVEHLKIDKKEIRTQVSPERTKNVDDNESYTIKVYFTEPKLSPLEKELIEVKKEKQRGGQKAYEQSVKIKSLITQNQILKGKISELLALSKIVREKSEAKDTQLQTLFSSKESLEENLTQEQQKENELLSENEALKEKISVLQVQASEELNVTKVELEALNAQIREVKNDLNTTQTKYDLLMQEEEQKQLELQTLLASKESLEGNLTLEQQKEQKLLTQNQALKEKISELLALSKIVREKSEAKDIQLQTLLSNKESLENNLTQEQQKEQVLLTENEVLKAKASKELNTTKIELVKLNEEMIQVKDELNLTQIQLSKIMQKEQNESAQIQTLLLSKKSLEENLTQEQQKENELLSENEALKEKISVLQVQASEELNVTKVELEALNAQIREVKNDLNTTQTKYDLLMQEEEQKQLELQTLLASKESLEGNLTLEQQKEQKLLTENQVLKEKIVVLQEKAKAGEELNSTKTVLLKLQNEYDKNSAVLKETVTAKESLEGNLTKVKSIQEKLLQENGILKTELEKYQGLTQQVDLLEKELNRTKVTYEKALNEEKNKESALVQKEQVCSTKLSELMLAIQALKEKKNIQVQGLLSSKQTVEEAFVQVKEKYNALMQKNDKLKQHLQEEQEVNSQMLKTLQTELKQTQEKMQTIAAEAKQVAIQKEKKELFDQFKLAKVAFKNDSAELTSGSKKRLDGVADTMKKYSHFHYKVQGHTDSIGNPKYNLKLSEMRAKSVKEYLISQGVDASILSSEGYGSSIPVASNKTKKGRLKNRRVVFEIIQP